MKIEVPQDTLQGFAEKYENAVIASGNEIKEDTHKQIDKIKSLKRGRSKSYPNKKVKCSE